MEALPFQKLKYNVHNVPHGTELLLKFPVLGTLDAFRNYTDKDRNYVIRYIIYCYDFNSDLVEQFQDLQKRKEAAADNAGFERSEKTGKFKDHVYEIMKLQNEKANDMVFSFLCLMKNKTWDQIVIHEEMFSEYMRLLIDPIYTSEVTTSKDSKTILEAANVKSKLREELKIIAKDLESLYKEFYGDHLDLVDVAEKIKPISPETIHKHIKRAS